MNGRILIVDDDSAMCELLDYRLSRRRFQTRSHTSAEEALAALANEEFDAVVTDVRMPRLNGLQLCERINGLRPGLPVVMMTAWGDVDTAVGALRAGAFDYIIKPFEIDALAQSLERAVRHGGVHGKVERLQADREVACFDGLIGESAPMQRLFELLSRISGADASVLITGESGTGKELVARALVRNSSRREGPFVAINCAAMPESLLESQLFGHVRGAFTDAKTPSQGLLVRADGGTLFLDEIGDMPLTLQPKLLRALQERVVRPVGGQREIPFDVRVIAATNHDLRKAAESGTFRHDLYYRLNVIHLDMPPLRERGGDILLLAHEAIKRFASDSGKPVEGPSPSAAEKLMAYHWPGNVRELHNCLERAVALTRHRKLVVDDLPAQIRRYRSWLVAAPQEGGPELLPVDEVERRHILAVLRAMKGNRTAASRVLGVDRKTLYRKLKQYEGGLGKRDS
jgi:two-component system response regulator HydG